MPVISQLHVPATLSPRKTLVHIDKENGWAPEQVWTSWIRIPYRLQRNSVSVQPMLSRLIPSTSNSDIRYKLSLVLQGRNTAFFSFNLFYLQGKNICFVCLTSQETFRFSLPPLISISSLR
jgi:hypothetical protein